MDGKASVAVTQHASEPDAVIVDEVRPKHVRLPSDLLRMLVALVAGLLLGVLGAIFGGVAVGATTDLLDIGGRVGNPVVVLVALVVRFGAVMLPLFVVTFMLGQRRYRRLLLVLFAAAIGSLLAALLRDQLVDWLQPVFEVATPEWVCPPGGIEEQAAGCIRASGFPSVVYLGGAAAAFGVRVPWINRRWRIAGWITLVLFLIVRSIDGTSVPADGLVVVAFGYAIGAATLLVFAAPDRRPRGAEIVTALADAGVDVDRLEWADVVSKSSTPYVATTQDGDRLFIKVIGPEERSADAMYRMYRGARLRGGESRAFVSVRRSVEHEAVVSLKARADGVQTPRLVGFADVGSNSLLLAYDEIDGRTLEMVADDELDDRMLDAVWEQLAVLRTRRTAHRNLAPGNIMFDTGGRVWIIDFGFAELGASDAHLNADVAELMLLLSARVGASRAVTAAVGVLGPDAVRRAAPRLQPMAVSTSVRQLIESSKGLSEDVQEAVMEATGLEEIQFEPLERVRPKTILTALAIGAAFYFLIPQLAQLDMSDIVGANWAWFPIILVMSALTYAGAAWALMGAVPEDLPFRPTLFTQVASSFLNRITPAKVGGMAANVRYLQKRGVDSAVAITGVGISNVGGVIVHVALLVVFVAVSGTDAGFPIDLPSSETVLVGLAGVLVLAGLVMVTPWGRQVFLRGVWPILEKAAGGVWEIGRDPMKLLLVFGGSLVTTASYALALWYSIQAFGGGIGFITATTVFLAGSAVAQVAPTPGGIGAAEAVLIAGLTAFGLASAVAVPAVFLYRIATFWLPILPGWAALQRLQHDGAL